MSYTGTHILRHGMAKLADHYSKSNEDDQKEFSEKIMKHIREQKKRYDK